MPPLTARQRECLTLVCRDHLTPREIADRLFVSPKTVRNHLHLVYRAWFGARPAGEKLAIGWACYALGRADADTP